jgi:hypothetical protein
MDLRNHYIARQPWLYKPFADLAFVIAPALLITACVWLFPSFFTNQATVPPYLWLILIVGIDVSHVYSTLYRTYLDKEEFQRYRKPLIWIPVVALGVGITLTAIHPLWFWRIMAYLAVYHFVRQQYGFFSLYARKTDRSHWERKLDSAAIYLSTVFPLVYWHTHPRTFFWFVKGDFQMLDAPWLSHVFQGLWIAALVGYGIKEILFLSKRGFNLPKNLILLGTALSWYIGIVTYNGDLVFTATNVVSHGIPYMALIWFYGKKKEGKASTTVIQRRIFQPQYLPLFIGFLLFIAYFEEGIWDGLIWRDHTGLFPWAEALPHLADSLLAYIAVPLLAVPQITHYVIDGFIWRVRKPDSDVRASLDG